MARRFNTAGPNDPADHHTWPAVARLPGARRLIDEKRYFVLHAPARSGKTTALLALARELTCEDRFAAVVLSAESGAAFSGQPGRAEDAILDAWQGAASRRLPPELRPPAWPAAPPGHRIARALQAWAEEAPRPLVVLIDDIDTLEGPALASLLRQIREGHPDRPHHFPWCVVLAGARDVPGYKIATGCGGYAGTDDPVDTGNEALTLRDLSRDEVAALYQGHTEETSQVFLPEAIDHVMDLTRGQPWLVSALARQIVEVLVPDRETAIDATHVDTAREILAGWRRSSVSLLVAAPSRDGALVDEGARAEPAPRRSMALARATARPSYPMERYRPERLSESFELGCLVLPDAVDGTAPPPLRRRSSSSLVVALAAGAVCGLAALLALTAGGGEPPAAATPSLPERTAAMLPAVVERAEAPPAASPKATAAPAAATAQSVSKPQVSTVPARVRSSPPALTPASPSRPPARPPEPDDPDGLLEPPRPVSRVVPALPPLQLDQGRMRRELEPKVWAGEASTEEIRMLKAICSNMGDHSCRDRARAMIERRTQ